MSDAFSSKTVSAKLLEPFIQLARHYPTIDGSDPTLDILQLAQISEAEFNKPGARFPEDKFPLVLEKLQSLSGNPHIALSLGEATQPQMLGSLGFLMSTAPNLELAYQILADYLPLIHESAYLKIDKHVDGIELTFDLQGNHSGILSFFFSCLINWPRHLTGQQVAAQHVNLSFTEEKDYRLYQQHFASEVRFGQLQNQLLINREYLTLSCVDANPEMHQLHREFADSLMSKIGVQSALAARTRNLIRHHLSQHNGLIRRDQVATELGFSLRTLQRKLGSLGSSFQDIYDDTRKEVCLQLIQRGEKSFGEIAYQLGFSNQSAFQKAFKRWMNTTPSEYRSQIKPERIELEAALSERATTSWLSAPDFTEQLIDKADHLSDFSCLLLEWASFCGSAFSLEEISALTGDPIARLAIYLWPSEQSGLIVCTDDTGDRTHFEFADLRIKDYFFTRQNEAKRLQRHHHVAQIMLAKRIDWQNPTQLFFHVDPAKQLFSLDEGQQIITIALTAAESAAHKGHFTAACDYQALALAMQEISQSEVNERQYWRLAELLFLSGDTQSALEKISQKSTDSVARALLQARILQHIGEPAEALHCLLKQPHVDGLLPDNHTEQLLFLVQQAEHLSAKITGLNADLSINDGDETQQEYQQLLEQIVLLARAQDEPLLAATVICLMVKETFEFGKTPHSAFAFASFAWVASWFCADMALASQAALASRLLVSTQQPTETATLTVVPQQDPSLILCSQVEHWFLPLQRVQQNLSDLLESCRSKHHWLEYLDVLNLYYQIHIYRPSNSSLSEINTEFEVAIEQITHPELEQKKTTVKDQIQNSIQQLQDGFFSEEEYGTDNDIGLCSRIINALLLDQQQHWLSMLSEVDRLEQSLPGYFCHTEVVFVTTLMRAILAQEQEGFSPKGQIEFTRQLSRLEMWAKQAPHNFSAQVQLIHAEKVRLEHQSPINLYEGALSECKRTDKSYITPLCYFRYADYLISQKQKHLASFCLEQAASEYQAWGATKAAKIVEQKLNLLAK